MPVSRMRMRPWLESRIDSNTIAGLVWVNKEEKTFSIPWKHAARHGWEVDKDACLFKQWAIHTGKFKEGVTAPDPKTWKANFRCAMNSLPDIEEVKDKSVNKGCGAVRVYRMLPAVSKKGKRPKRLDGGRRRSKVVKVKAEEMSAEEMQTQVSTIDSTDNKSVPSPAVQYEVGNEGGYSDIYMNGFQVSPMHSEDFEESENILEESEAILELTRQLERESNLFGKGFLANEVAATESLSPESQWSVSSGEELELRLYTELTPELRSDVFCTYTELWNSNTISQTMCPL